MKLFADIVDIFNPVNIVRMLLLAGAVKSINANPIPNDDINCNIINYNLPPQYGVYDNRNDAERCSTDTHAYYRNNNGNTRSMFVSDPNTDECAKISTEARIKGHKRREDLTKCPVNKDVYRKYFKIQNPPSECNIHPKLPCKGEEPVNYNICNAINYDAGLNGVKAIDDNTKVETKIPKYDTIGNAKECLSKPTNVIMSDIISMGTVTINPKPYDEKEKDCREISLQAGLKGYDDSIANIQKCPRWSKDEKYPVMKDGKIKQCNIKDLCDGDSPPPPPPAPAPAPAPNSVVQKPCDAICKQAQKGILPRNWMPIG